MHTISLAWIAGVTFGLLIGALIGFAYGLQSGKSNSGITPSIFLSRDDALTLVGHRLQQIVRRVRSRIPPSKQTLSPGLSDEQLVDQSEFGTEYHWLQRIWSSLRYQSGMKSAPCLRQEHLEWPVLFDEFA